MKLEARLEGREQIAGDRFSCADAMWVPTLGRLELMDLLTMIADLPHVTAYYARMKARPSFAKAPVVIQMPKGLVAPARAAS